MEAHTDHCSHKSHRSPPWKRWLGLIQISGPMTDSTLEAVDKSLNTNCPPNLSFLSPLSAFLHFHAAFLSSHSPPEQLAWYLFSWDQLKLASAVSGHALSDRQSLGPPAPDQKERRPHDGSARICGQPPQLCHIIPKV